MTLLWIAGAMSGTSLDGVDAALLRTDGDRIEAYGPTAYRAYAPDERAVLRAALTDAAARATADLRADPAPFAVATRVVTDAHRAVFADLLAKAASEGIRADLLAPHGQTVIHRPEERFTLQILDAQALADALALPVAEGFRLADVAAGGQGAPLAPLHHFTLARAAGLTAPLAVLNLGGVGNVSFLDPSAPGLEAPGAILAFDTGPANALLDDWMAARARAPFDADGRAAAAGQADEALVARWMQDPYFAAAPPKSLDRDAFAALPGDLAPFDLEDGAATLARFTAASVAAARHWAPKPPARWLATGGGRRNPTLMARISEALGAPIEPIETLTVAGRPVDGDMLEACAFAQLAARIRSGAPLTVPGMTGVATPTPGGRLVAPRV